MLKVDFCINVQSIMESLRKDQGMSLENMAITIGVSKKTLIQIEKNRNKLKWPEAVTFVTIFSEHDLVKSLFGDEVSEIVQSISKQKLPRRQLKTLGGESWWNTLKSQNGFRLQQHKISKHLRIIDSDNYRVFFTYSKSDASKRFAQYMGDESE